jgi:hypothetical protein
MSTDVIETGGQITEQREPLSVTEMRAAMTRMTEYRDSLMTQKVHFGTVPGCGKKPTLLKPGAEILIAGFNTVPRLKVDEVEEGNGHKTFTVTATLHDRNSDIVMGEGVGSCSTLESKYRYRNDNTGEGVPRTYWDTKNPSLIGGDAYVAKKIKGNWMICLQVEYKDPADYWNTCLKMAKKRALVDAALTMAAASELFTQDIEDMPRPVTNETTTATAPPTAQDGQQKAASGPKISEAQKKRAMAIGYKKGAGIGFNDVERLCKATQFCSVSELRRAGYDAFCALLEDTERVKNILETTKKEPAPTPKPEPLFNEEAPPLDSEAPPEYEF